MLLIFMALESLIQPKFSRILCVGRPLVCHKAAVMYDHLPSKESGAFNILKKMKLLSLTNRKWLINN